MPSPEGLPTFLAAAYMGSSLIATTAACPRSRWARWFQIGTKPIPANPDVLRAGNPLRGSQATSAGINDIDIGGDITVLGGIATAR